MALYDPGLTTTRDQVRFLIGDTDNNNIMLENSEIEYLLSLEGDDVFGAASRCCDSIAAMFAREVDTRFSTLWQNGSQAHDHYVALSARLQAQAGVRSASPEFTYANIDPDSPSIFWIGMDDNPAAEKDPS